MNNIVPTTEFVNEVKRVIRNTLAKAKVYIVMSDLDSRGTPLRDSYVGKETISRIFADGYAADYRPVLTKDVREMCNVAGVGDITVTLGQTSDRHSQTPYENGNEARVMVSVAVVDVVPNQYLRLIEGFVGENYTQIYYRNQTL